MAISLGKLGEGDIVEVSVGNNDIEQILLGQNIIWEKPSPYVPGTMILIIETTKANQVVNLGYNLGRWQNTDKAAKEIPHYGTVNWGDETDEYTFTGTEGIEEEGNGLVHTYTNIGEHRITIKGVIKWNRVSSNTLTPNSIQEVLKKIEIPKGETSPIYFIDQFAFSYYKNLESIPEKLFENCTEVTNFFYCFYYIQITAIPQNLFAKCTKATNFGYCFYSTKITEIPSGLFDQCTQATDFTGCFNGTHLAAIPQNLFAKCTKATNFHNCFNGQQITAIPEGLFDQCTQATKFSYCFYNTKITEIPSGLFDQCTKATDFNSCFENTKITAIPQNLFANNNVVTNFSYTFSMCRNVKGNLPALWESHSTVKNHTKCFQGCSQADNYQDAVAAGWT